MKKLYTKMRAVLLLAMLSLVSGTALAQVSFYDAFGYDAGDLYNQGPWLRYGSNTADPVQVVEKEMSYAGFPRQLSGKAVRLGNTKSGEDLFARFSDNETVVSGSDLYYAALINVEEATASDVFVMSCVVRTNAKELQDGISSTELSRLYIKEGAEGKFQLGVERGATKVVYSSEQYNLGETYLVVVKYENTAVQDNVKLYVNPASYTQEPETADAAFDGVNGSGSKVGKFALQGVQLRQGTNATATAPVLYVGAVSVSDTYAGLFGGEIPVGQPSVSFSPAGYNFETCWQGTRLEGKVTVKGRDLTGDVAVSVSGSDELTVAVTTISAEEAMAGYELAYTVDAQSEQGAARIVFSTEGADDVEFPVTWTTAPVTNVASLRELADTQDNEGYTTFRYTGSAVVTFVNGSNCYVQDATGALLITDEYEMLAATYKTGDRLTGFLGTVSSAWGANYFVPYETTLGTVVEEGAAVQPFEVTLADLADNKKKYVNALVSISGLTAKDVAENAVFESNGRVTVTEGEAEGVLRVLPGTDLIGEAVPAGQFSLTGISTSATAVIISPRAMTDIAEVVEPSFTIDPVTFTRAEGKLGETTVMATFAVHTANLAGATEIYVGGTNRNCFVVTSEPDFGTDGSIIIPAGTHDVTLTLSYVPVAVGAHRGNLIIDCPSFPDGNLNAAISGIAIDPENLPEVTATPLTLDFTAEVGQSEEKTVDVTSANLPENVDLKVLHPGSGFLISTTTFYRNLPGTLRVTFAPNVAGEVKDTIRITTYGAEPIDVVLHGVATATAVTPGKEGDVLPLDDSAPLKFLFETFDGVERNKPLAIEGWKNLAEEGTRAWWGYELTEAGSDVTEYVAKVTPYDSKETAEVGEAVQMTLVTPALDFVNGDSRMFTFRVRGDYLQDGQEDILELYYIEKDGDGMYASLVGGFTMPATADQSGEWQEFHLDLEGQELADVFFMGFRFKSYRDRSHAATYYIDDVTYGRTDIPLIRPSELQVVVGVEPGQTVTTEPIEVKTTNLTEPITLSLSGADKANFELSTTTLPAEGGSFTVSFKSDTEGTYGVYVKLASRGAADQYIEVFATNVTAVDAIKAEATAVEVFDLSGRRIRSAASATQRQATAGLPAGVYLVKTAAGVSKVRVN